MSGSYEQLKLPETLEHLTVSSALEHLTHHEALDYLRDSINRLKEAQDLVNLDDNLLRLVTAEAIVKNNEPLASHARKEAVIEGLHLHCLDLEERLKSQNATEEYCDSGSTYVTQDQVRDLTVKSEHLQGHLEVAELQRLQALTRVNELEKERDEWKEKYHRLHAQCNANATTAPAVQQTFGANSQSSHHYDQRSTTINNNTNYLIVGSSRLPPTAFAHGPLTMRPSGSVIPAPDTMDVDTPPRPRPASHITPASDADRDSVKIKTPRYSTMCKREANGDGWVHSYCNFFHQYQMKQLGHIRSTLPKDNFEAKRGGV